MTIPMAEAADALRDPLLPTLSVALDPKMASQQFQERLTPLSRVARNLRVARTNIIRYKPGRRCVVEYDLEFMDAQGHARSATILGKVRAKRFGNEGFRRQRALWSAGFDDTSPDGISVPEPLGVVPMFQMWFQRKIEGRELTDLLRGDLDLSLAARVADIAHKLHRLGPTMPNRHTIVEEVEILRRHLPLVTEHFPAEESRIEDLLVACEELIPCVTELPMTTIHRDYYPDQIMVAGSRLYLLDLDLCCQGDSALDVGNFLGHLQEHALRFHDEITHLQPIEHAIKDRFLMLAGEEHAWNVRLYTLLTLVRHIYLSTRFAERRSLTLRLLDRCEQELQDALQEASH